MTYLLDTNAIAALHRHDKLFVQRARDVPKPSFFLSTVVLFELTFGALRSQRVTSNIDRLASLPGSMG